MYMYMHLYWYLYVFTRIRLNISFLSSLVRAEQMLLRLKVAREDAELYSPIPPEQQAKMEKRISAFSHNTDSGADSGADSGGEEEEEDEEEEEGDEDDDEEN